MQRAPCFLRSASGYGSMTCFQSLSRSLTGRYGCLARLIWMKPRISPMRGLHHGFILGNTGLSRLGDGNEHTLVVLRDDFNEFRLRHLPVVEQLLRHGRARVVQMLAQQLPQLLGIGSRQRLELDHLEVAA